MRELLEEAREILGDCYYDGKEPLSDGTRAMVAKVIKRIDAALAEPEPDAEAIAERIEQELCGIEGEPGHESVVLDIPKAAALIESYGRRVPRAMLKEIWDEAYWCNANDDYKSIDEIAAKYGVEVEG
jgi:hypothetical protein